MAFCTRCGQDMQEASFCPNCGAPAAVSVGAQPPPSPAVPPPGAPAAPPMASAPPPVSTPAAGKVTSTGAVASGAAGVLAMVVVAIGSALPWATVSYSFYSASKGGLSGDGVITLIAGVVALAFFAVGTAAKARWPFIVALILSLIVTAVAIIDTADIAGDVTVGIGLILCLIAGIVGVVAGIGGIAAPRRTG